MIQGNGARGIHGILVSIECWGVLPDGGLYVAST